MRLSKTKTGSRSLIDGTRRKKGSESAMLEDVRYGIRTLSKSPGFSLLAVLILAMGVGTNTAVFSLVNASLLRPVPGIKDSQELVTVGERHAGPPLPLSYPDYFDLRQSATAFTGLLSTRDATFSISVDGEPERVRGSLVSGNFFSVLGIEPFMGRTIIPEDDRSSGEHPVAVLAYGFWQRRFGADPGVPGRALKLNGRVFTIVGVAPDGFGGLDSGKCRDVWIPSSMEAQVSPDGKEALTGRELPSVTVIGRLKPGTGVDQ